MRFEKKMELSGYLEDKQIYQATIAKALLPLLG